VDIAIIKSVSLYDVFTVEVEEKLLDNALVFH